MKSIHKSIYILPALILLLAVGSCSDEPFVRNEPNRKPTNMIRFDVSSGFSAATDSDNDEALSRSGDDTGDDDEGLDPLVLTSGRDTIYLHRYVAPESERATGRGAVLSRATPITGLNDFKTICADGFLVNARFTEGGEEYFGLSKATQIPPSESISGDLWYLANPHRYWPDKRKLRFHAVAPASAKDALTGLNVSGQTITFGYTVPSNKTNEAGNRVDAEHQPDIMMATTEYVHDGAPAHADGADADNAPLNFRHALSAIKFAVRDVSEGQIIDISINGVHSSGTCVYDASTANETATNPGDYSNGFTWTVTDAKAAYTQTFNYTTTDPYGSDGTGSVPSLENATVINNSMPEKTFMLMPQEIPADARLVIRFKPAKPASSETGGTETDPSETPAEGDDEGIRTFTAMLWNEDIPRWQPGKEYIYTISTSSYNWTYVFNVLGSLQEQYEAINFTSFLGPFNKNPQDYPIHDGDSISLNHTVTDGYYKVQSYRYRTNNPNVSPEPVPWTVTYSDGTNTIREPFTQYIDEHINEKIVSSGDWVLSTIPEGNGSFNFSDEGSVGYKKFDISLFNQYVATDYPGDWWMRSISTNETTEASATDLSMSLGSMNTANCYMVNKGGWYKFPLVYGNAMKGGATNPSSYTFEGKGRAESFLPIKFCYKIPENDRDENGNVIYREPRFEDIVSDGKVVVSADDKFYKITDIDVLQVFQDYEGNTIKGPWINPQPSDAMLIWEDVKGLIDEVKRVDNYIYFHVNSRNLMQGNAVIAALDGPKDNENSKIMWSWHIWATDYCNWARPDAEKGPSSDKRIAEDKAVVCDIVTEYPEGGAGRTIKIKEQGINIEDFTIAPVYLGWCDSKSMGYLERTGVFNFRQDYSNYTNEPHPDLEENLPVKQREHVINYIVGNNTYYTYGHKDPSPGFVRTGDQDNYRDKETFGNRPWFVDMRNNDHMDFGKAIQKPYGYANYEPSLRYLYNLWNNYYDPNHLKLNQNFYDKGYDNNLNDYYNNIYYGEGNLVYEWNSYHPKLSDKYLFSGVKTVYDPCPPGFIIPPYRFFDVFTNARNWNLAQDEDIYVIEPASNRNPEYFSNSNYFNGDIKVQKEFAEGKYMIFKANSKREGNGDQVIIVPTGSRYGPLSWARYIAYPASNMIVLRLDEGYQAVFGEGIVDGHENVLHITSHFRHSNSQAYPILCVKEFDNPEPDPEPTPSTR